jgi:hypothetical protein
MSSSQTSTNVFWKLKDAPVLPGHTPPPTDPQESIHPFPTDYGVRKHLLGRERFMRRRRSNRPGISQAKGPSRYRTLEREGSPSADGESHARGEALRHQRQRGSILRRRTYEPEPPVFDYPRFHT